MRFFVFVGTGRDLSVRRNGKSGLENRDGKSGLDIGIGYWNGIMEWNNGIGYWNGIMGWNIDRNIGIGY